MGASQSSLASKAMKKEQLLSFGLLSLERYIEISKYIFSFLLGPSVLNKVYVLLMKLKFQMLKVFLNRYVLKFSNVSYYNVSQWIVNHSTKFASSNTLSICTHEDSIRFGKNCSVDDIIVYDARPVGEVFFNGYKIHYALEEDKVTFASHSKTILNNITEEVVKNITNITRPLNSAIDIDWYKPKVFTLTKEATENKKITTYVWKSTSEINERVSLFFDDETIEKVIKPFDDFFSSRALYHELGIAYKLVSVFSGKPGMGKTATVKYLAQKFSRDIYMFTTLELTKDVFLKNIKEIPYNSIILFDDFDKMYIDTSLSVTMLGLMDGVITMDGSCMIFVLNDYSMLEETFITMTRPGRINLNLDFNTFDTSNIVNISIRKLFIEPDEEDVKEYLSTYPVPPKISEVKNDCLTSSRNIKTCIRMRKQNELVEE